MKKLLLSTVMAFAFAAPAYADSISLFSANQFTDNLSLQLSPPPGNQPQNIPCLICGTNQPQQPLGFGFNNYKQAGNVTSFVEFSSSTVGAKLDQDEIGTGYAISFLKAFLISQLDLNGGLNVGIDVNTATGKGPEVLEAFAILDLTQHTILSQYSLFDPGGTPLPTFNNGTGFPDYLLTGFNIDRNDINPGDSLLFYAQWDNTSDGAESFFLVPAVSSAVPEPSTWAMGLAGFAFLGFLGYRKSRKAAVLA